MVLENPLPFFLDGLGAKRRKIRHTLRIAQSAIGHKFVVMFFAGHALAVHTATPFSLSRPSGPREFNQNFVSLLLLSPGPQGSKRIRRDRAAQGGTKQDRVSPPRPLPYTREGVSLGGNGGSFLNTSDLYSRPSLCNSKCKKGYVSYGHMPVLLSL